MSNSITGGLESLLGIDTNAGSAQLQQALQELQSIGVPSIASLTLPQLQQYVSAGVLSPQSYQAVLSDPQSYSKVIQNTQDNSGSDAQKSALQQLGGIAKTGSTPIMQAQLLNALQQTNQTNQASRGAISENAKQRGVAGGGLEFMQQLAGEQNNAQNANLAAVNSGANNAQLALQALSQQGQLGGQLQSQSNQASQAQAQAAQQIAQYNAQMQNTANEYNTTNANQAQQMNLSNAQNISNQNTLGANQRAQTNAQLPQQVYQDQLSKAQGLAGVYGQQANLAQQHAQQDASFTGGLIGAGATLGGSYLGNSLAAAKNGNTGLNNGFNSDVTSNAYQQNAANNNPNNQYAHGGVVQCYAQGGEVHDHQLCMKAGGSVPGQAQVPGDSTQNDTVPARLSPGEVVIPRSVAQAPNAPAKAAQFMAQAQGSPPGNFAALLKTLEANGLELRLSPKGA